MQTALPEVGSTERKQRKTIAAQTRASYRGKKAWGPCIRALVKEINASKAGWETRFIWCSAMTSPVTQTTAYMYERQIKKRSRQPTRAHSSDHCWMKTLGFKIMCREGRSINRCRRHVRTRAALGRRPPACVTSSLAKQSQCSLSRCLGLSCICSRH